MSKHTPGPWILQPDMYVGEEYYEPCVTTEQDEHTGLSKTIAVIRIGLEGSRANARLIAAAPELLEELQHFVQGFIDGAYVMDYEMATIGENAQLFLTRLNKAKAAIAKATEAQ